jgi:hypothetical protein
MVTEVWPEHITEKSWRVLNELAAKINSVVIGGWAVYFWTKSLKSADIDLFVKDENLWKLGARVTRNRRLTKYHAVINDVDVDIYTPSVCRLTIPVADVYENRWHALVGEFEVLLPEPLLILKSEAAKSRWKGRKGFKDRCDILSLLMFKDLEPSFLTDLVDRYKCFEVLQTLELVVKESLEEYKVLGLDAWTGRKRARGILRSITS